MNRRETIRTGLVAMALGPRLIDRTQGLPAPQMSPPRLSLSAPVTPETFGAVGDGTTDDTAALQAAVDAAAAARRPLQLNPGQYKVAGTIVVSTDQFQWSQQAGAVIHCYGSAGPTIRFAGRTRPMAFLVVDGLRLVREVDAHRQPMVELGDANGLSYFTVQNVFLDGQSRLGDGIHLVSAYNGRLASVMETSVGGIGAVFRNDPSLNVGNITFANWVNNASPIMFFIQEYYGHPHNVINSLNFENCKHALPSGGKFFASSAGLSGASGSGQVTVAAADGANFAPSDWVVIIQQSTGFAWADRVDHVLGDVIRLTGRLPFAIGPGDSVIAGRWHTVLGGAVSSVEVSLPHFERVNGLLGAGGQGVRVLSPYLGTNVYRGAYLARSSQQWEIVGPRGALPPGGIVLHQANHPDNSRNAVRGASLAEFGHEGSMIRADGGTACYWSDRFQGTDVPLGVWHQDGTVAASQSRTPLLGPSGASRPVRMRSRGSLVALVAQVTSDRTSGSATATVFRNGAPTSLSAILDARAPSWVVSESEVGLEFRPGDAIDVRVSTDVAWAPTSNDFDVTLYVSQ